MAGKTRRRRLASAPRTAAQRAQGPPKSRQQKTLNADHEKSLLVHAASFFIEQGGRCSKEFAQFVASRHITTTSQSAFLLGYAPNDSAAFLKYLAEAVQCRPESPELLNSLERVGLWKKSVGAPFFRNRIMFPVADRAGNIVGFAGRKVNDEDPGPKYLNSPETPYFNKSQLLYGMQAFCGLDKNMLRSGRCVPDPVPRSWLKLHRCHCPLDPRHLGRGRHGHFIYRVAFTAAPPANQRWQHRVLL